MNQRHLDYDYRTTCTECWYCNHLLLPHSLWSCRPASLLHLIQILLSKHDKLSASLLKFATHFTHLLIFVLVIFYFLVGSLILNSLLSQQGQIKDLSEGGATSRLFQVSKSAPQGIFFLLERLENYIFNPSHIIVN